MLSFISCFLKALARELLDDRHAAEEQVHRARLGSGQHRTHFLRSQEEHTHATTHHHRTNRRGGGAFGGDSGGGGYAAVGAAEVAVVGMAGVNNGGSLVSSLGEHSAGDDDSRGNGGAGGAGAGGAGGAGFSGEATGPGGVVAGEGLAEGSAVSSLGGGGNGDVGGGASVGLASVGKEPFASANLPPIYDLDGDLSLGEDDPECVFLSSLARFVGALLERVLLKVWFCRYSLSGVRLIGADHCCLQLMPLMWLLCLLRYDHDGNGYQPTSARQKGVGGHGVARNALPNAPAHLQQQHAAFAGFGGGGNLKKGGLVKTAGGGGMMGVTFQGDEQSDDGSTWDGGPRTAFLAEDFGIVPPGQAGAADDDAALAARVRERRAYKVRTLHRFCSTVE